MRDIGANLAGQQFVADHGAVMARARAAGVEFIDITGTDLASSRAAWRMAQADPAFLGSSAGIHPHGAKAFDDAAARALQDLLREPEVLLCGEMGLDYARNHSTPEEQRRAFEAQLDLAAEVAKPLFLHCRDAFDEFVAIMDGRPGMWRRSIVHCFTGDASQAAALCERGAHIGVTGWIADKRRNAGLLAAVKMIPAERLLIETDAPYLMPLNAPKAQGRDRNEPAHLKWVAEALGRAIGMPADEVAALTLANADRLIGRPARPAPARPAACAPAAKP